MISSHLARIEYAYVKCKLALLVSACCADGKDPVMEGLTPASPDGLPPFGDLVADDPFWRYPSGTTAGEGVAQLRIWLTAGPEPGHLAAVTETGSAASVTASAGHISVELTHTYGPSLVLLEHYPAAEGGEGMETLDLVRIGADGSPHWLRVWPTPPCRKTPVMLAWSAGWPPTGTRSSAGPRAGLTGARTRAADRRTRKDPVPGPQDGRRDRPGKPGCRLACGRPCGV
jgi:hypothetical protein